MLSLIPKLMLCCLLAVCAGCGRGGEGFDVGPDGRGDASEMVFYGVTTRIRGFDPVRAGDVASSMAISRIYEGLLQYSYLARPYELEPCLAAAMPDVSEDGLVYTFRIRPGIYFQDDPCFTATGGRGRELVAEDFVYSIKRIADVKNLSTGYWAFNNRIVGLDEFRAVSAGEGPTDYDLPVEGLQAVDDHTLQIKLLEPYPQLLHILAMHYAFAVPREAVEFYGNEFLNRPVGTGPYRLVSWRRNYRVEFERDPKWAETGRVELYPSTGASGDLAAGLLEDAGKPIPFIDRFIQLVIPDLSTRWLVFLTGQIESSGISRDNWDAVITEDRMLAGHLAKVDIRMYSAPSMMTFYIGFNMDDPVVGPNKPLRQALTSAFDSEQYIKFNNDRVIRARGPIPPGIEGYEEKPALFPFDLDRAAQLLAEAGYPGGTDPATGRRLRLTIDVGSAADPETRASMELIAGFFDRIGVRLDPVYNNWPAFLERLERRQIQLYSLGWVADYPDAENFLQLFYGPNRSPGPNHSCYSNSEFDALYEKVRIMPPSEERTALYRKMADIIIEDCPWIFMSHPLSYGLNHGWVRNFKPHDFPYGMAKYYAIDEPERQRWRELHGVK